MKAENCSGRKHWNYSIQFDKIKLGRL